MIMMIMMRGRFEGWYYKHQSKDRSLAIIPGRAEGGAFVQVITDSRAYMIPYPLSAFQKGDSLHVGENTFSLSGITLDISHPEVTLSGEIRYTGTTPICGDIMGPFRFFPMECRHGIASMKHELCGAVSLNGEVFDFTGGLGYIESDSGRSFPSRYIWVQCNDFEPAEPDFSVMVSVARIPFYGVRFWGCICVVWLNGREYRLATYNGVKIVRCEPGLIDIKQGKYQLTITVGVNEGQLLAAPRFGTMDRVIRESLSCPARFRFMEGNSILFDQGSDRASYECMME
ncbi:MAG: tocopherol cyclase family protein [Peptococcaceae bacterium]|nr:tocopherol cyclase family protein [Peptococcaceae bacterium]